ncbi:hypothetical protein PPACK8108_LOCUS3860 [Phakopsora pachyrhizi]|uniref:Uncharacterized protein n=1 Tax=Phakopsora pachyrhizi TaxID=170000 RepID=A0AAV0APN8_PHAPC|nr:hypothetical protein PPACK8108_LOCUS3860 [Phakopsora pachyrhizi]
MPFGWSHDQMLNLRVSGDPWLMGQTQKLVGLTLKCGLVSTWLLDHSQIPTLSRNSQGTVDEVKKQIELGLLGSSKGRIQLVVLMNLYLKFRNKERTKAIQDLSQSLDMTNDDSRENRRKPTRQ